MSNTESLPAQESTFNPNNYPLGYKSPEVITPVVDTERIDDEILAAGTAGAVILKEIVG
jgi:hypothetical protein